MIFVDTSVLLDLITEDPVWASWSQSALSWARGQDRLAINDVVYAELSIGFERIELLDEMVVSFDLTYVRIPRAALFMAGKAHLRYRRAGGIKLGVLPDFFIGAQAVVEDAPLMTRDIQRMRAYFPSLRLIAPDRSNFTKN